MTTKPKLNQPDVETTVTQPNLTIEKATPEQFISGVKGYIERLENENERLKRIVRENEYTIKTYFKQPTLSDCIKEWESRGWTYSKSKPFNWLIVEKNYKKIIFDGDEINYSCAKEFDIDLELNDLITKTLKALEVEDD